MKGLFGVVLCLPFMLWGGIRIVADIQFDRGCEGYLKRAADANTVELARKQLAVAVDYAKREALTQGYTSVLWRTPDEDVGFWFENISNALDELNRVGPDTTQLERSNVLIKLRETLLDQTKDGTEVTVPEGISIFPHNTAFFVFCVLASIVGVIGAFLIFAEFD